MPPKSVGEIDLFAPGLGQCGLALMSDDTNHLDPFRLRSTPADEDALSHGGFIGKCLRCEKLVYDHYVPLGRVIRLGERATGEERRADHFKVTWEYKLMISRLKLARVRY